MVDLLEAIVIVIVFDSLLLLFYQQTIVRNCAVLEMQTTNYITKWNA